MKLCISSTCLVTFKENQVEDISLYPNPIDASERLKIKVPESFVGGTARLLDYNGRELMSYPMTKKRQELDLGRVSPGQYLMEFNKGCLTKKEGVDDPHQQPECSRYFIDILYR